MKFTKSFLVLTIPVLLFSCVSEKKVNAIRQQLADSQAETQKTQKELGDYKAKLKACDDQDAADKQQIADLQKEKADLEQQKADLNAKINELKEYNNSVLGKLSDLSVITKGQEASIKKSLANIQAKDNYIKDLMAQINRKDSLNNALVNNLKSALVDINDKDINIKVEKGVVYIDISDKLLFKSGSYSVTERAKEVLGKVARILNAHTDIDFMIEGHTDSIPFHSGLLLDNWDLSAKRATSVARILQYNYQMDPKRMTVAGHGEYIPLVSNSTSQGRALNRRTRIVILPQLDQFFKLLEKK
jgi:chemotaxis protein MotB